MIMIRSLEENQEFKLTKREFAKAKTKAARYCRQVINGWTRDDVEYAINHHLVFRIEIRADKFRINPVQLPGEG